MTTAAPIVRPDDLANGRGCGRPTAEPRPTGEAMRRAGWTRRRGSTNDDIGRAGPGPLRNLALSRRRRRSLLRQPAALVAAARGRPGQVLQDARPRQGLADPER